MERDAEPGEPGSRRAPRKGARRPLGPYKEGRAPRGLAPRAHAVPGNKPRIKFSK